MNGTGFFIFFLCLLLIGIVLFMFIYTGYEYDCYLPNGGHFTIRWNVKLKKFETLHWQPKGKAKKLPKKILRLEGKKQTPKPAAWDFLE